MEHSKAFRLTETGFEWIGDYEITADEVLGGIAPKVNKLEQAKKMLRELAETSTSVQSSEIFDMAEDLNISKRTLENAKKELGIKARRSVIPGIGLNKVSRNKLGCNIAEYIENAELKCKVAICKDIAVLRPYINCKKVRT